MHTIGVFDSGIGGKSVALALERDLPQVKVIFVNDTAHVPYGSKPMDQVLGYVVPILEDLVEQGCEAIVIACNTVTTNLIQYLRLVIAVPLIGIEPMIKPAAEVTKSGVIAICATPATLKSERYKWLKQTYAKNLKVVEPDCSDWSSMIESNKINHQQIQKRVETVVHAGADVIVLGCTHYHWIENEIKQIAGKRVKVLQPESAIVSRVLRVMPNLAS